MGPLPVVQIPVLPVLRRDRRVSKFSHEGANPISGPTLRTSSNNPHHL